MAVSVIKIEQGEPWERTIESFSPADIVASRGEAMKDYRRDVDKEDDVVVGIKIKQMGHGQTVVTLVDRNANTVHYIGPTDHFVMDPPIDEEPAYDNYI